MTALRRPRAWLPLVVFAVCVGGPLAVAPTSRAAGADAGEGKTWICEKCGNEIAGTGNSPPTTCPKCGAKFSVATTADGSTSTTDYGKSQSRRWYYIYALVGVAVVAVGVWAALALRSGGKTAKKKKKKARRPRDDDD